MGGFECETNPNNRGYQRQTCPLGTYLVKLNQTCVYLEILNNKQIGEYKNKMGAEFSHKWQEKKAKEKITAQ